MDHPREKMIIVIVLIEGRREEIVFQSVDEIRSVYPQDTYNTSKVGRLIYVTKA